MPGLTAAWASDNTGAATVSGSGVVSGVAVGSATITATVTTADGTFEGSSEVAVAVPTFPLAATVTLLAGSFSPNQLDIAATGEVTFNNTSGVTHNVNFSSQAATITDYESGPRVRRFDTPGTVQFSCNIHPGMSGTLTIH
jgi:plastocyanin